MAPFPGAVSPAAGRLVEGARKGAVEVASGRRGAGAGVLWPGGFVLTNDHVIPRRGSRRRGTNVRVTLPGGRSFGAEAVARDPGLDLAILRPDGPPDDVAAVSVGDSDSLRVGELVFAVGHPWGRPGVATAGIVSGLGPLRGSGRGMAYVRSDVSLAPGNSGGPLLNARGEVVGINAMVVDGFAFSIPSNAASAWAASVTKGHPPRLGVGLVPAGPGMLGAGLVVAAVEGGGPAERAGILVGDVLVGVDGAGDLGDGGALRDALARSGGVARLRILRGGRALTVSVRLGGAPESAA